jgi:hypothetical protein
MTVRTAFDRMKSLTLLVLALFSLYLISAPL